MLLLDTHIVVWLAQEPELLSGRARTSISEARQKDGLAISDKTLWEIAMLTGYGKMGLRAPLRDFLQSIEQNVSTLSITAAIAERSMQFSPRYPKDPADRIIGATALANGMDLVTADRAIRASGEVPCIW